MKKTTFTADLKGLDFKDWSSKIMKEVNTLLDSLVIPKGFELYVYRGVFEETMDLEELRTFIRKRIDIVSNTFANKPIILGRECLVYEITTEKYQTCNKSIEAYLLTKTSINILNSQSGGGTATGLERIDIIVANTNAIKETFQKELKNYDLNEDTFKVINEYIEEEYIYNHSFSRLIDIHSSLINDFIRETIENYNCLTIDTLFDSIIAKVDGVIPMLLSIEEEYYSIENKMFTIKYNGEEVIKIKPTISYEIVED